MGQIEKIIGALERAIEKRVTKTSLDVHANLVAAAEEGGTPVDTGWASANWSISIGRDRLRVAGSGTGGPDRDAKTGKFKSRGARRSDSEVASAQAGQAKDQAAMLFYKLPMGAVYVVNNVDYIVQLNLGFSPQAKAMFVERAINKALTIDSRKAA